MHRLFVAIRPPPDVRDRLLALMGGVAAARWQTGDQLHLTLRFIGEVDRRLADDVDAALTAVRSPRFGIRLDGVGSFGRRGRAEALWAGVSPVEPLRALHKKIDQALVRTGLEPERRAYVPHITLARLKANGGAVGAFVEVNGGLASAPFEVTRFSLYESSLTPAGAIYREVASYPLT